MGTHRNVGRPRTINQNGFAATWNILQLNRHFPQEWTDSQYSLEGSSFGVKMVLPVNGYQIITRSVKYAILFIILTFTCFFTIEILKKYRVHPIQYSLVGLALILFFTLLLSFSEQIGFNVSYGIAAAGIVLMISLYTIAITQRKQFAFIIGAVLIALYSFMYLLLQLEDYALISGSIGLFIILSLFMYLTRNIDWYNLGKSEKNSTR